MGAALPGALRFGGVHLIAAARVWHVTLIGAMATMRRKKGLTRVVSWDSQPDSLPISALDGAEPTRGWCACLLMLLLACGACAGVGWYLLDQPKPAEVADVPEPDPATECWMACGQMAGYCDFCGVGGACCRDSDAGVQPGCPPGLATGLPFHTCVVAGGAHENELSGRA